MSFSVTFVSNKIIKKGHYYSHTIGQKWEYSFGVNEKFLRYRTSEMHSFQEKCERKIFDVTFKASKISFNKSDKTAKRVKKKWNCTTCIPCTCLLKGCNVMSIKIKVVYQKNTEKHFLLFWNSRLNSGLKFLFFPHNIPSRYINLARHWTRLRKIPCFFVLYKKLEHKRKIKIYKYAKYLYLVMIMIYILFVIKIDKFSPPIWWKLYSRLYIFFLMLWT